MIRFMIDSEDMTVGGTLIVDVDFSGNNGDTVLLTIKNSPMQANILVNRQDLKRLANLI